MSVAGAEYPVALTQDWWKARQHEKYADATSSKKYSRMEARLRKGFQYRSDSSGEDDARAELDEEEQEHLIESLRQQNELRNQQVRTAFIAIPLVLILPYTLVLFNAPVSHVFLLGLLGVTSLASSAYTMAYLPLQPHTTSRPNQSTLDIMSPESGGPVEQYLGLLNLAICGVLAFASWALWVQDKGQDMGKWVMVLCSPAVVLGVILIVRREMRSVDIGELEGLRYQYKGA